MRKAQPQRESKRGGIDHRAIVANVAGGAAISARRQGGEVGQAGDRTVRTTRRGRLLAGSRHARRGWAQPEC